jgi:23S rRNA (pseudouridine1915-N3)-methyltransferase
MQLFLLFAYLLLQFLMISSLRFGFLNRPLHKFSLFRRETKLDLTTNIIIIGKKNGGEDWIQAGYLEYEKRLSSIMNIQTVFLKSDDDLLKIAKTLKGSTFALDEKGSTYTSKGFTELLYQQGYIAGGSVVNFLIGGYAGLPNSIRNKYPLISLSAMTWTHQMARLLLIEQIYRASEIQKGSDYHKE